MEITVGVPKGFNLEKSVCNHGFFMMAPNRWNPFTKTLVRPLRLIDRSSISVSISQPDPTSLSISVIDHPFLPCSDHQVIKDQVIRMLRLSNVEDEQLKQFHKLHIDAAKRGFGHLFRNPCLFEDIVKSLLLCCCTFSQSLDMAQALCVLQKRVNMERREVTKAKRGRKKQCREEELWGNFPSAQDLAILKDDSLLRKNCKLGYRAAAVWSLAKNVTCGKILLEDFNKSCDGNELFPKLMSIHGFGEFVTTNVLMCMGFYRMIPCDSETVRHIQQIHHREDCQNKNVKDMAKEIYDKYAPFQSLAYWLELVDYYESKLGKLSLLDRSCYKNVAGSMIDKPV